MSPRYGQHFLSNRHAIERIVGEVDPRPGDSILEIGPGQGALTPLLTKAKRVVAIEVDEVWATKMRERYGFHKNLEVVQADILEFDLASLKSPAPFKVVGNLPYNLTSPILRALSEWTGWSTAVVMVQKEVGDRLAAAVGSPDYGALTVGMNLTCTMEKIFDLSERSFNPPPKVRSSVIRLRRRDKPLVDDIARVQRVVQAAFQQRRKTIENSLSHGLGFTKEQVRESLAQLGLDPGLRAERLSVDDFLRVTRKLLPSC